MAAPRVYRIVEDDGSISEMTFEQAFERASKEVGVARDTVRKRLNEQHKRKAAEVFASAASGRMRSRIAFTGARGQFGKGVGRAGS